MLTSLLVLNITCAASDSKSEPLLGSYAGSRIDGETFYRNGKKCTAMKYYSGLTPLPIARIIDGKYNLGGRVASETEYKAVTAVRDLRTAQAKITQAEKDGYGQVAAQAEYERALQKVAAGMEPSCCCMQ